MPPRAPALDRDGAEAIALAALAFLAEDEGRLGRFLALSGIGPRDLRDRAGAPEMLGAVLDHLAEDEALLMTFAAMKGIEPSHVAGARMLLAG